MSDVYLEFVLARLAEGETANDVVDGVEDALERQGDWALWGDDTWRRNTVCARCGSPYAGICGSTGPRVADAKGCTDEPPVMYSEFVRRQQALGQPPSVDAVDPQVADPGKQSTRV